jgi:hypothetical protein
MGLVKALREALRGGMDRDAAQRLSISEIAEL